MVGLAVIVTRKSTAAAPPEFVAVTVTSAPRAPRRSGRSRGRSRVDRRPVAGHREAQPLAGEGRRGIDGDRRGPFSTVTSASAATATGGVRVARLGAGLGRERARGVAAVTRQVIACPSSAACGT